MTRLTVADLKHLKDKGEKIVSLSCHTYPTAKIADPLCEIILVGDSVGMVLYGMESTRDVSMDMIIAHGKAVCKATNKALIIVDMPFGTYESSKEVALSNAQKIIDETNAQAVKLEGGQEIAKTIEYLVKHNINVAAHIGLLPQSFTNRKDFRIQGRNQESQMQLIEDIHAVTHSGAFCVVIEGVTKETSDEVCQHTDSITIGIGAGDGCDGQILVIDDIIGTSDYIPKFARIYEDSSQLIHKALSHYSKDVKSGKFPSEENMYKTKKE